MMKMKLFTVIALFLFVGSTQVNAESPKTPLNIKEATINFNDFSGCTDSHTYTAEPCGVDFTMCLDGYKKKNGDLNLHKFQRARAQMEQLACGGDSHIDWGRIAQVVTEIIVAAF